MRTASKPNRKTIAVGDSVWIPWGGGPSLAVVIEDRGHIGYQGRRVLRVTHGNETDGTLQSFEIPEAEVKLHRKARAARRGTPLTGPTKNGKHTKRT